MLRVSNTKNARDLYLIPIAVNYDLVLEDDTQVRAGRKDLPKMTRRQKLRGVRANARLLRQRGLHGFGYAVINVGTPLSLRAFAHEHGIEFDQLAKPERIEYAKKLATRMMDIIGELVPVLPVSVLANVFVAHEGWISARNPPHRKTALARPTNRQRRTNLCPQRRTRPANLHQPQFARAARPSRRSESAIPCCSGNATSATLLCQFD